MPRHQLVNSSMYIAAGNQNDRNPKVQNRIVTDRCPNFEYLENPGIDPSLLPDPSHSDRSFSFISLLPSFQFFYGKAPFPRDF